MRKTHEELYEEAAQQLVRQAISDTEEEIAYSAFDEEPPENDGDMTLEQSEGWDGGFLSEDEQWETTLHGDDDRYPDGRPLEGRERDALASENEELRRYNGELAGRLEQVVNGPERQAQLAGELRDRFFDRYGFLPTDDAKAEAFFSDMARQEVAARSLSEDRVNRSMADAHAEHGRDFEEAFRSVTSMDARNPTARALIADVWNSPDPGARLMALHQNGIHGGLSRSNPPSLNSMTGGYRGGAPSRGGRSRGGGRDLAGEWDGFGNRSIEEEIAQSVWD